MSEVRYKVLSAEDWLRIPAEAWDTARRRPQPEHTILLAAESEGRIIGCIGGQQVVMVAPFWVAKEFRGSGVAQELARQAYELHPMSKVMVTENHHAELLALRMGFDPLKGTLWLKDS